MRIHINIQDSDTSTARFVNRLLAILNILAGLFLGLCVISVSALVASDLGERLWHLRPEQQLTAILVFLVLVSCVLQIAAGCALLFKIRGARELALFSTALFVWYFPVGTLLCFATWWFLMSDTGRNYYGKATPAGGQRILLPV